MYQPSPVEQLMAGKDGGRWIKQRRGAEYRASTDLGIACGTSQTLMVNGTTSDDEVHEVRKVSELLYSIRDPLSRARAGFAINGVKDIHTLINRDREFTDHTDYADHEPIVLLASSTRSHWFRCLHSSFLTATI
jgi:hypothetical protein